MKIGAQLYTVRDYAQTVPDLAVTLRKIAEMGYRTVQCSQVGPIDPYLIKEMLDENNLQSFSLNPSMIGFYPLISLKVQGVLVPSIDTARTIEWNRVGYIWRFYA